MDAASIFTRTRLGLDTRVWAFLLAALLFSAALFGFRVATTQGCKDITINAVNSDRPDVPSFYANDRIVFTVQSARDGDIAWDFGDNTAGKGARVTHGFAKPGTYFVTVTVNEKCREFISVTIRPQVIQSAGSGAGGDPAINGPEAPKAGEMVNYYTNVNGQTYEWNVLNSPMYETQRIAVASYTFNTAGPLTLELKVDGQTIRKEIQVLPGDAKVPEQMPAQQQAMPMPQTQTEDPTPAVTPAGPKAKMLPPEEFTDMLKKVTKGDMNASSFEPYLCEGGTGAVRVLLNDKDWTNLSAFCEKISKNKKYNIKNTQVIRDDNGCVKQLKISYCKWVILGLKCKED